MAARTWGRIRLLVRAPGGAAAELPLDGAELIVGDARLAVVRDGLDVQVPRRSTQRLWLVRGGGELRWLHVVDVAGDCVCERALEPRGGDPAPLAVRRFDEAWRRFGEKPR